MKHMLRNNKKAFTLIELLLVIGIIAVLAVVVFVALNPAQRFLDARNSRRTNDVESILSAIHQNVVDTAGSYPAGMPAASDTDYSQIGTGAAGTCSTTCGSVTTVANCADLTAGLASYLKTLPIDPAAGHTALLTGYAVNINTKGLVTIKACAAEGGKVIEASR